MRHFGVPSSSCFGSVAHSFLHSLKASARETTSTCAIPFAIFVFMYTHFDRHSSKALSYLSVANTAVVGSRRAAAPPIAARRLVTSWDALPSG